MKIEIAIGLAAIATICSIVGGIAAYKTVTKPQEKMFFGQQFNESDLKGSSGKLMKLAVACDLTTTIIPDIMSDGFVPFETSRTADVDGNAYLLTFWKRIDVEGDMRIVTESDKNNLTCIISVSNNVKSLQSTDPSAAISGKSRDILDGYLPV